MNPEQEKELEAVIGRALQGLPDLAAPPGLLMRTMTALEQPAAWHARAWTKWPAPMRMAFLTCAIAAVVVVIVGWRFVEPGLLAAASRQVAPLAHGLSCFWKALSALAGAAVLAVEHLGKGFILVWLVAAAGAWAFCAGLGTMLVRFAFARPGRNL